MTDTPKKTLDQIVDKLLDEASTAVKSEDALRFSQAALNAANTKAALDWKPSQHG